MKNFYILKLFVLWLWELNVFLFIFLWKMTEWYKICPYCGEEIKEIAKKCRYCHEFLDEDIKSTKKEEKKYKCNGCWQLVNIWEKKCPWCWAKLSRWDKIQKEIGKKKFKCARCWEIVKFWDKKCPECWNNLVWWDINKKYNNFRSWEELTLEEQKYISKKLSWWRILTVFLTQWWLIRCKRRWDLSWYLIIGLILMLTLPPLGFIFCIIARIIVLSNFSKEAYKHDMPYFQKYLDEYAELHKKS